MPTSTVEQYVKTIYHIAERTGKKLVGMKQLSDSMGVTPGTATAMVKNLADGHLVVYTPRRGVSLAKNGHSLAMQMVRRHRLIETFLERVLSYDWAEIHDEAERLEHAVSDLFVQRVAAMLGQPAVDPHGDPIPTEDGRVDPSGSVVLSRCQAGDPVAVARVDASDAAFLKLMREHQVLPGELFEVTHRNDVAGTLSIRHRKTGGTLTLSLDLAHRVTVSVE